MKKTNLIVIIMSMMIIMINSVKVNAQYNTALGVRVGGTSGLTAQYFYKPDMAIEGILGSFGNGYSLTGLVEKFTPVFETEGLYLYYGGGLHLAAYNGNDIYYSRFGREIDYHRHNDVAIGFNGVVGLLYRLPERIPLAFTLDLKPFVEIGSGGYVGFAPDPSIGIKYIFK